MNINFKRILFYWFEMQSYRLRERQKFSIHWLTLMAERIEAGQTLAGSQVSNEGARV